MSRQGRALARLGLLLVHGIIIGACSEWPGLSIATLLLAFGYYSFFLDNLHAALEKLVRQFNSVAFRRNQLSSTTKVCCPTGGYSGLNEQNQSIAQSETPNRSRSSHKLDGAVHSHIEQEASTSQFLVLLMGIVAGLFMFQPWLMHWSVSHRLLANAVAFGVVLSAIVKLLITTHLMGLKEFFALLSGLFCIHVLLMLPSMEGRGVGHVLLSGGVGVFTCYLPGVSTDFIRSMLGLPIPIKHVGNHALISLIGFGLGFVLALVLLTFLLFFIKKKARGLLRLFLAGLMVGTFPLLWPWQQVDDYLLTGYGQAFPLSVTHLSPSTYATLYGEPAHFLSALVCILVGFTLTCITGRQSFKNME